jgi:hypothetical protein
MKLAERSRKIFVEALTNPPKPNDAAIAAAKRFKQEVEVQPSSGPPTSRLEGPRKQNQIARESGTPPL